MDDQTGPGGTGATTVADRLRAGTRWRVNTLVRGALAGVPGGDWHCPVCNRTTRLAPVSSPGGLRRWASCVRCGAMERHRLQAWVLRNRVGPLLGPEPTVLHVAPDPLATMLRGVAGTYVTAGFHDPTCDLDLDLRATGLPDAGFDLIWASHVLEHIDEDDAAIAEVARLLRPGGIAVLPVPIVGETTIEYGRPMPLEELHVRAPGLDYFDRLRPHFATVDVIGSGDAPTSIQPFVFEDRSKWPTADLPLRTPSEGRFHADHVPVCRVASAVDDLPSAGGETIESGR